MEKEGRSTTKKLNHIQMLFNYLQFIPQAMCSLIRMGIYSSQTVISLWLHIYFNAKSDNISQLNSSRANLISNSCHHLYLSTEALYIMKGLI